ncbi:MAG: hypothetical protein KGL53_00375, partial [Elusimicrobia bacterium]|nr:hypothetical protein [Elusimicrobiota bacterium]
RFILRKEGWSTAKLWGRRVVLDPAITGATGFIAAAPAISANGGNIFEYILGPNTLPQDPQARR